MSDPGCYRCTHHAVCKYWDRWNEHFPYKNDAKIGPYLTGLAVTLAEACKWFEEEEYHKQQDASMPKVQQC